MKDRVCIEDNHECDVWLIRWKPKLIIIESNSYNPPNTIGVIVNADKLKRGLERLLKDVMEE